MTLDRPDDPRYLSNMHLTVNGTTRSVDPEAGELLADTLRERLHLTGTKVACGRGECGACTVLLNGKLVYSCLTLTMGCDSATVETVEGLETDGGLHPVQAAFVAQDAAQCGFCTPGQVMAAVALLRRDAMPDDETIRRAMSGNLCRCGTYPKIVLAIHAAAESMREPHAR